MQYQYKEEQRRRTIEPRVSYAWVLATIVSVEAAWLTINSTVRVAEFNTDYVGWQIGLFATLLQPALFTWVAYVLWRPKFLNRAGRRSCVLCLCGW